MNINESSQKEWVSPDECAKALGVTPETVRRWLRTGVIAGRKFGKLWMVHLPSVVPELHEAPEN